MVNTSTAMVAAMRYRQELSADPAAPIPLDHKVDSFPQRVYIGDVRRIGEYLRDSEDLRRRLPDFDPAAHYKDSIDDPERRERSQGHRAVHLLLPFPRQNAKAVWVEVQTMTMFQEGWDKKDHPIYYEKRRLGQEIPPIPRHKIRAISDTLYLTDDVFDDVRRDLTSDSEVSGDQDR
jgi:ppGpp synthetase/RelA/SpoT-type nucleotidyltranferase